MNFSFETINCFHDGGFSLIQFNNSSVVFKIEIQYLANELNKLYKNFYLTLNEFEAFEIIRYDVETEKYSKLNFERFFEEEPEFLSLGSTNEKIEMVFSTGILVVAFKSFKILDHEQNEVTAESVETASSSYWERWHKQNQRDSSA